LKPFSVPEHRLILLDEVASTNNYAISLLASEKVEEGTIVLTFRQTQGRGHGKNVWKSEDFKNLTFSLILYPDFLPSTRQFLLSQVISLGLFDFLSQKAGGVAIKWPNDLLIDGRKISGILIENAVSGMNLQSCVAGIGLNINQISFPGHLPLATSLSLVTGKEFDLHEILCEVISQIMKWYESLKKNETSLIRDKYGDCLFKYGEICRFRKKEGIFSARIAGTDELGGVEAFAFKSVEMIY
jgi:BirA family biotin operon repressor/biotin-[acetyl-CoA-carboxylase] ligase